MEHYCPVAGRTETTPKRIVKSPLASAVNNVHLIHRDFPQLGVKVIKMHILQTVRAKHSKEPPVNPARL
jgi:hypothetical protein